MQYTVCNYIQSKCYKCMHVHLVRYKVWLGEISFVNKFGPGGTTYL